MNIVIDTNVIVSAVFFGGSPNDVIKLLLQGSINAYVSPSILDEYQRTVEKIHTKYPRKTMSLELSQITATCKSIEPKSEFHICRDPDDDKFIECAYDAKCIYIVSGDKDLLSIGNYADIEIVTVAEFLSRYLSDNANDPD